MADHPISAWIQYTGDWHEITTDVLQSGVKVAQGTTDVTDAPKASKVNLTLLDGRGDYQPHNPSSLLYGKTSRNTPFMLGALTAYEDFEDTSFAITITNGAGVNPWARSSTSPHAGGFCFKSGVTAASAVSDCVITVPAGATMCTLWYRTDCATGDVLQVFSGGKLRVQASGAGGAWTPLTLPVSQGSDGARTVYLRYIKDASGTAGADAVYIDDVRFWKASASGEASWSPNPGDPGDPLTTGVEAAGVLQRLGRWNRPVESAYSSVISQAPHQLGCWLMEDAKDATTLRNQVTGGKAGYLTGGTMTTGEDDSPDGGSTSLKMGDLTNLEFEFLPGSLTGWQMSFAFKLAAVPAPGSFFTPIISWATSDTKAYTIYANDTEYDFEILDPTTAYVDSDVTFGTGAAPNQWIVMNLAISLSGGTASWKLTWYAKGLTSVYFVSGTFAATSIGYPTLAFLNSDTGTNPMMVGAHFGYLYAVNDATTNTIIGDYLSGFLGFAGEPALDRIQRICQYQGIPYVARGATLATEAMGAQKPDTMLGLFKEIQQTDGGLLTDADGAIAVAYRSRRSLYAQTPALALIYGINVSPPLTPILDDIGTYNYVTVTNRAGEIAIVEDSTGIVGSADPPTGAGLIKQDVGVNVSDPLRLPQLASWWLNAGTNPEPRYKQVTVDLDANPSLEATVDALLPGDRVTISGLLPDLVDLLYLGRTDTRDNRKRRKVTLLCIPYLLYDVATYAATGPITAAMKRYESKTSTLNAGVTSSATTIVVTFTAATDLWSTASVPYDWDIEGERITVTVMGAITGTGPWTQSATVTRAVNGVSKAHTAGVPIQMHRQQEARYAL